MEKTHYYPFGLTMSGISSKAIAFGSPQNKKKYNGYEFNTDLDLNLNESFYRLHDPQIGRFLQLDPKPTDYLGLYVSMNDNPINLSDPLGDIVKYEREDGVTKQEFRQFKREIRLLRRNSETFKQVFKEFKRSSSTYTYIARNNANGGGAPAAAKPGDVNIGVGIHSDESKSGGNKDYFSTQLSIISHESAHAWLNKHNLEEPYPAGPSASDILNSKDNSVFGNALKAQVSAHNNNELKAVDVENVITSELMKTGKSIFSNVDLRSVYYGGQGVETNFEPGKPPIYQKLINVPLNTLAPPHDRDHYMNNQNDIYEQYQIKK